MNNEWNNKMKEGWMINEWWIMIDECIFLRSISSTLWARLLKAFWLISLKPKKNMSNNDKKVK